MSEKQTRRKISKEDAEKYINARKRMQEACEEINSICKGIGWTYGPSLLQFGDFSIGDLFLHFDDSPRGIPKSVKEKYRIISRIVPDIIAEQSTFECKEIDIRVQDLSPRHEGDLYSIEGFMRRIGTEYIKVEISKDSHFELSVGDRCLYISGKEDELDCEILGFLPEENLVLLKENKPVCNNGFRMDDDDRKRLTICSLAYPDEISLYYEGMWKKVK